MMKLGMRTTVEIPDEQRSQLVHLAAERGEKGFSIIVQEAIELYLSMNAARRDKIAAAQSVLGTLDDEEAEILRASVAKLRKTWR